MGHAGDFGRRCGRWEDTRKRGESVKCGRGGGGGDTRARALSRRSERPLFSAAARSRGAEHPPKKGRPGRRAVCVGAYLDRGRKREDHAPEEDSDDTRDVRVAFPVGRVGPPAARRRPHVVRIRGVRAAAAAGGGRRVERARRDAREPRGERHPHSQHSAGPECAGPAPTRQKQRSCAKWTSPGPKPSAARCCAKRSRNARRARAAGSRRAAARPRSRRSRRISGSARARRPPSPIATRC